jgi:hypothetical protein
MNSSKHNENRKASDHWPTGRRLSRGATGMSLVFLTGCRGAPSINLLGSFFPGWMLCMVLGIAGAFMVREVCIRMNIEPHLQPRVPVYLCLWGLVTLLAGLLFFRS